HGFIRLAKELPPLGMANNHALAARVQNHAHRDFASERPFFLPIRILRCDCDGGTASGVRRSSERGKRRRDHNVAVIRRRDQWQKALKKRARIRQRLIHLPVSGNHRSSQDSLLTARYIVTISSCSSAPRPRAACAQQKIQAKRRRRSKYAKSYRQRRPLPLRPPNRRRRQSSWRPSLSLPPQRGRWRAFQPKTRAAQTFRAGHSTPLFARSLGPLEIAQRFSAQYQAPCNRRAYSRCR